MAWPLEVKMLFEYQVCVLKSLTYCYILFPSKYKHFHLRSKLSKPFINILAS
jgi:hypothetical protein